VYDRENSGNTGQAGGYIIPRCGRGSIVFIPDEPFDETTPPFVKKYASFFFDPVYTENKTFKE